MAFLGGGVWGLGAQSSPAQWGTGGVVEFRGWINPGMLARVVRCEQCGWSTPSSLSGEDSCFVFSQKGGSPTGLIYLISISALVVSPVWRTSLLADNMCLIAARVASLSLSLSRS